MSCNWNNTFCIQKNDYQKFQIFKFLDLQKENKIKLTNVLNFAKSTLRLLYFQDTYHGLNLLEKTCKKCLYNLK